MKQLIFLLVLVNLVACWKPKNKVLDSSKLSENYNYVTSDTFKYFIEYIPKLNNQWMN
jgi:hypothetical protein